MKLFAALLALLAFNANAGTITLYPSPGFGYLHQYHGVVNEEAAPVPVVHDILIYAPDLLLLDGVRYFRLSGSDVFLDPITGATVTLVYTETSVRKYISQGRLHRYVTIWTLTSGSIVQ